ncbi:2-dehydropantoate 2-reductase [Massilibacterium senegalense]|uniref:2-dehydropantoate 2-reductase n=1 Tax=Massilibacterium senegalense TaxID=1632858 RepID=UPI000784C93E|nr:2-dehydropantoate 2-reductase [Massilibacterium senegalense]
MNIHIIGSGSIGLLLAAYLSEQHDVTVYTNRMEQKEKLFSESLCLEKEKQKIFLSNLSFQTFDTYTNRENSQADLVFIAVKQYHLQVMMPTLQTIQSPCVFLQNGMGHLALLEHLTCGTIGVGVITHGALRKNDTTVVHTGMGNIKVGAVRGDSKTLHQLVDACFSEIFPITYEEDILPFVYEKLFMNAIINPLTALYRVKNGELVKNPFFTQSSRQLYEELKRVFPFIEKQVPMEHIFLLCERTSENQSSMLKDIDEKRKTEIDAIVGYVLQEANKQALDLPCFQFVYSSIKGLEV